MKMPVRGRLSDRYGWRNHPVYRKRLFHAGIDVAAPKGTPIVAAMSGKVIYSGRRSGYGKIVILSHSSGYSTRYGHCSSLLVKKGQYVKAGQTIARVGATGVATGNHLHFEVRKNGKTVNPLTYLK
jgi:murein DD-endopeptidase MepM/ murein hydrolase activator NlpD